MRSQVITIALLVMLGLSTVALGLIFGGGASIAPSSASPSTGNSADLKAKNQPIFVVRAQIVANDFIGTSAALKVIPGYMFTPIANLPVVLVGSESPAVARRGLIPSFKLLTNSSGLGEIAVPRGNFTVSAFGGVFNFSTSVSFRAGVITDVSLYVIPSVGNVSSLVVANQDTIAGAEPNTTLYANVRGAFLANPSTSFVLSGKPSGPLCSTGQIFNLTITGCLQTSQTFTTSVVVIGSYPTPEGTMVVLKPVGLPGQLPLADDTLLQYRTNSTVDYLAS